MGEKVKKVYDALVEGAVAGETASGLFAYVKQKCPKATSKRIVKASLLALSDPDVNDANVLHVIYALAIKHRLDPASAEDLLPDADDAEPVAEAEPETPPPSKAKPAKKKKAAKAD